ncbi:general transcription factor IIE subunit 2-like [Liolophura sinensis]|uniref:general transcription factor IIE subunit 2-like n=1 Tax=Liolophura sinensis TaxID=3198878 RepID=UPI0031596442
MDPELLKDRNAFIQRALSRPVVERKPEKRKNKDRDDRPEKKKSKLPPPKPASDRVDYKSMQGSSQYKFSILAKIVKYLKKRHQAGDYHPLTIDEILDETNQLDIGARQKHWLSTEALLNNPKVEVTDGFKFAFKPKYNRVRDKVSLLKLLRTHDLKGLGGILLEDIEEALPRCDSVVKALGSKITFITRPIDKKKIIFYNDADCQFTVDDEFKKLWRSVTVEGVDDGKIDDYLEKQGIKSMQDIGLKTAPVQKRRKANRKKRNNNFKKHNEHLQDILQDYSEK